MYWGGGCNRNLKALGCMNEFQGSIWKRNLYCSGGTNDYVSFLAKFLCESHLLGHFNVTGLVCREVSTHPVTFLVKYPWGGGAFLMLF